MQLFGFTVVCVVVFVRFHAELCVEEADAIDYQVTLILALQCALAIGCADLADLEAILACVYFSH